MRCSISAALVVAILIILSFTAGCTIPFFGNQEQTPDLKAVNVGINPSTTVDEATYMSMEEAYLNLKQTIPVSDLDSNGNPRIYYIQGSNLDTSGKATRWMFGVNRSTGSYLMNFEGETWTEIPWNARLPQQQITTDKIVYPGVLFSKNSKTILADPSTSASEIRDLDLRDGSYSLTIVSGGSTRYLTFNAATGEPVVLQ
jgi:hypothetical protein